MVEQTAAVEPHTVSVSTTTTPATVSSGGPKITKLATKSGFVIPKNKLSGSLVPVYRGAKKPASDDTASEEKPEKVHRKTKWGPDLTQDVAVRRARALAYQTRVDQITEQLKSGNLEVEDRQEPDVEDHDHKSASPRVESENLERLEFEKREVIGEILKLNPNYKIPPGYKPVLKETTVPVPVKEYQGYNFLGLIFGPSSDTHKRLEKETGATIKVYGNKADTGEKVEISPSDGNDQGAYEELYIHISANTYEKVDAASDLIELLITSISESLRSITKSALVSGENVNDLSQSPDPHVVLNQGVAAPMVGATQAPLPQGQFQYQSSWFPLGLPQPSIRPLNSSAPVLNNPVYPQSSPQNPLSAPSLFGPRPGSAPGFSPIQQNLLPAGPAGSQPFPVQVPPNSYMSHVPPMGAPKSFPTPASGSLPYSGIQTQPTAPLPSGRPLIPSQRQDFSGILPRPDRPLNNLGQSGIPLSGPRPGFASGPIPQSPNTVLNHPAGPGFALSSHHQAGHASTATNPSMAAAPRPQQPSSNDFTFRPLRPQSSALPIMSRPSGQLEPLNNTTTLRPMAQPPPPQPPSFRVGGPNAAAPPSPQVLPRPHMGNLIMGQNGFVGNPNTAFGNVRPVPPTTPGSQLGPRNFGPAPQLPNLGGLSHFRPGNQLQLQHNYRPPTHRPENQIGLNQHFGMNRPFMSNNRAPSPRGSQIYDPFSPNSDL